MSLLSRHVSEIKSEEFVLGVSTGWEGEKGTKLEGVESTKLSIVAAPSSQDRWTGFVAIDQKIANAEVGRSMKGKAFPARCFITYRRVSATEKKVVEGREVASDVEKLVVVGIEYICQVDLVDVKVAKAA